MNDSKTINKAWQQYETGKEHKRRIGLYETVRQNERFYRGEQWQYGEGKDLPKPVFNIVYRVMNYLVCSVASANISLSYRVGGLETAHPFGVEKSAHAPGTEEGGVWDELWLDQWAVLLPTAEAAKPYVYVSKQIGGLLYE
jgi:hypothetical protein